jgi:hypothetical protein
MVHAYFSATQATEIGRRSGPSQAPAKVSETLFQKWIKSKRTRSMAQAVEHLPTSISSAREKKVYLVSRRQHSSWGDSESLLKKERYKGRERHKIEQVSVSVHRWLEVTILHTTLDWAEWVFMWRFHPSFCRWEYPSTQSGLPNVSWWLTVLSEHQSTMGWIVHCI